MLRIRIFVFRNYKWKEVKGRGKVYSTLTMDVINLGILAHVDAGKTTLTEGMLYESGIISKMGKVDDGTTVTDSMELEKKRGITIKSSVVSFLWNNVKINLIDTPGHLDFVSEVESALHVIDVVVLVISAKEGIQSQTRLIFRKIQELKIPTIIYINKLDRVGVDYGELLDKIRNQLSEMVVALQEYRGVGEKEVQIINLDFGEEDIQNYILLSSDTLMEKYDDFNAILLEEYEEEFIKMVRKGELYPLVGGVALKKLGITEVMDLVTKIKGNTETKSDKLSAYVYKIEHDKDKHERIYFRVFNGAVKVRDNVVINADNSYRLLVRNLWSIQNNTIVSSQIIRKGDIGIIMDEEKLQVGSVIGEDYGRKGNAQLKTPLLQTGIKPKDENERNQLLSALTLLSREDPYLKYEISRITNEIKIWLFGPLQMEIIGDIFRERFGINVCFTKLEIVNKEHPLGKGYSSIRLRDWNNPYNAGAVFQIEPLPLGSGFQYENHVSYGYLEKPFQNAVLDGIKIGLSQGINGHQVIDVKVSFLEADYDSVLGTPADFRRLVPIVIHDALADAGVELLEPWQKFTISVPKLMDKSVLRNISKLRARVTVYDYGDSETTFAGKAALSDMMNYESVLNTYTSGKGFLIQEFYKYLPKNQNIDVLMELY